MFRSGFIALVGMPNAGKSTLVNSVVGEKVTIVTPKPQTTRRRVMGIVNTPEAQIIFADAPGVLENASSELNKFLIQEYRDVLAESDAALAILPADERDFHRLTRILELVENSGKPYLIVVTKADQLDVNEQHELAEKLRARPKSGAMKDRDLPILFLSPLRDPEISREAILKLVPGLLPESPALYDPELFTTETLRDMAAETIREKCFLNLNKEIPFGLAVKITAFKEEKNITRIEADILVEREAHKKIVIGQGASMLKKIGSEARGDLEQVLGQKVFLGLHVVCKPRWMLDRILLKELGYGHRE